MTAENLKHAFLGQIVAGYITQGRDGKKVTTWEEIRAWPELNKAHAVANGMGNMYGSFLNWDAVKMKKPDIASKEIQAILQRFKNLGWDGTTKEDFMKDFDALKNQLRKVLSPQDWETYFSETSRT